MHPILKLRLMAFLIVLASLFVGTLHGAAAGAFTAVAMSTAAMHILAPNPYALGALVQLSDRFIPKVYGTLTAKADVESTAFVRSGVAVRTDQMDALARSESQLIEVPRWGLLSNSTAPNLSDDTENKATPLKIGQDSWQQRTAYLNQGFKAADLAEELGAGSPMQAIKDRVEGYWGHAFQNRNLAVLRGLQARNVASNSGDMVHSVALETTVGQAAANWISRDNVVLALATLGDAFGQTALIIMHSTVYFRLVRDEEIEFVKPSVGSELVPTYLGKEVVVDDGMPVVAGSTSGFKYTTAIVGRGLIRWGTGTPHKPEEVQRAADEGNGGGTETLWTRRTWLIHPFGHSFIGTPAGKSATIAELATAANWDRKEDRKAIPLAYLVTNG